jgi:hypothetical protein
MRGILLTLTVLSLLYTLALSIPTNCASASSGNALSIAPAGENINLPTAQACGRKKICTGQCSLWYPKCQDQAVYIDLKVKSSKKVEMRAYDDVCVRRAYQGRSSGDFFANIFWELGRVQSTNPVFVTPLINCLKNFMFHLRALDHQCKRHRGWKDRLVKNMKLFSIAEKCSSLVTSQIKVFQLLTPPLINAYFVNIKEDDIINPSKFCNCFNFGNWISSPTQSKWLKGHALRARRARYHKLYRGIKKRCAQLCKVGRLSSRDLYLRKWKDAKLNRLRGGFTRWMTWKSAAFLSDVMKKVKGMLEEDKEATEARTVAAANLYKILMEQVKNGTMTMAEANAQVDALLDGESKTQPTPPIPVAKRHQKKYWKRHAKKHLMKHRRHRQMNLTERKLTKNVKKSRKNKRVCISTGESHVCVESSKDGIEIKFK